MSEQQYGVPIDFALLGRHTDTYARIIGGRDARVLGTVYRAGEKSNGVVDAKSTFDTNAKIWLAGNYDGVDFGREFTGVWRRATRAHTQLAEDLFGDQADNYDLTNRIASAPILPHDLYRSLVRPDANPRYAHEARWLTTFAGIILAAQERENDPDLRTVLQKLDGTIQEQLCVGTYGHNERNSLMSWHDPNTLETLETRFVSNMLPQFTMHHDYRLAHESILPIRKMEINGKIRPVFTSVHEKNAASVVAKTLDRALRPQNRDLPPQNAHRRVFDPRATVRDFHGLNFVTMNDSDYEQVRDAILQHVRNTFPDTLLEADHDTSHGLGTESQFERWNACIDPHDKKSIVEIMFQRASQYLNGRFHIGKIEDDDIHDLHVMNGYAHDLHRIRRMLLPWSQTDGSEVSAVQVLFPEKIYGVDPSKVAEQNMQRIAQRIRGTMIVPKNRRFDVTDIA